MHVLRKLIPALWVFFSGAAAADQLNIDSFSLGQSLAKAREALSGYASKEEALNGAVYRIIAAKKGEALMLGFDHDKIVMISKTTLQDSNSNIKESDLTRSLMNQYGKYAFPFAFSEGDAKYNALVWGENLKEEAGNPFFCVIFQIQTRRYLSTVNVSEAFYSSRDNVWKIPFALQQECPEANYSSGGPGGRGYHQPNAGKVRVVHWLAENGQVTSVQESLLDHAMNGTAPVVAAAAADAPLPSSDVYRRIIGQANFPLF